MKKLKLIVASFLFPALSFGWNGIGHSTGGAIAYYYLKQHNPATIFKVVNILQHHPWYNDPSQWGGKLQGLSGEQHDVALFMLASTFPDDARSIPDLGGGEKPKWHFVDYPFTPPGDNTKGQNPESPNAEDKIPEMLTGIKSEKNAEQRALDMCWVFHLIEDVHQPLHTACMFDANHPDGDRGGNSTFFTTGRGKPQKLHSYWDGLVKGSFETIPGNAEKLLKKPAYKESKLTELKKDPTVKDWINNESFPMAKEYAYNNGAVNGTGKYPSQVDRSYASTASKTAERRIVLAGIRIGQQLEKQLK